MKLNPTPHPQPPIALKRSNEALEVVRKDGKPEKWHVNPHCWESVTQGKEMSETWKQGHLLTCSARVQWCAPMHINNFSTHYSNSRQFRASDELVNLHRSTGVSVFPHRKIWYLGDNFIATTFSVIRFVCSKSFWTWKWNLLQTEIWFWLWNFTILVFWEPIVSLLYNSSFSKIIDL